MRVLHVITSLSQGGAENMLYNLLAKKTPNIIPLVICFRSADKVGYKIEKLGIRVIYLSIYSYKSFISSFLLSISILYSFKPNISHLWMYHPNLFFGLLIKILSKSKIIWSIHHSNFDKRYNKSSTLKVINISKYLSYIIPDVIIYCSKKSLNIHNQYGFCSRSSVFVPNGINTEFFKPLNRYHIRQKLNFKVDTFMVGYFARWDRIKNHKGFLTQFKTYLKDNPFDLCLLCGDGMIDSNKDLMNLLYTLEIPLKNIILLGNRDDMPDLYNSIDVYCLASHDEAFPLVLCEAMSCGVPCISTDVGDAFYIIGSHGSGSSLNNIPLALKNIKLDLCNNSLVVKTHCRNRIVQKFSLDTISEKYHMIYKSL